MENEFELQRLREENLDLRKRAGDSSNLETGKKKAEAEFGVFGEGWVTSVEDFDEGIGHGQVEREVGRVGVAGGEAG